MVLNIEIFNNIKVGEIFKVVTTKIHSVVDPVCEVELKFICKKGMGNDWAIYAGHPHQSIDWIKQHGQKVISERNIRGICPCTDEVLKLYRY